MSANRFDSMRFFYTFLTASRVFIGFGANPLMGKKYILSFTPNYFLPKISKIYVLVSLLGHAMGPLIEFICFAVSKTDTKVMPNIIYSKYNCSPTFGRYIYLLIVAVYYETPRY